MVSGTAPIDEIGASILDDMYDVAGEEYAAAEGENPPTPVTEGSHTTAIPIDPAAMAVRASQFTLQKSPMMRLILSCETRGVPNAKRVQYLNLVHDLLEQIGCMKIQVCFQVLRAHKPIWNRGSGPTASWSTPSMRLRHCLVLQIDPRSIWVFWCAQSGTWCPQ